MVKDTSESELECSFLARVARVPHAPAGFGLLTRSLIGRVLDGRFRLLEVIGKGGTGIVFRAVQLPIQREVAVKILRPALGADELAITRFESEARIIAELRHPNVVKLIDCGRSVEGLPYMVTELLSGTPLSHRIGGSTWREERVMWLLSELCCALVEAHSKDIVHRDLKPSNVFLERVNGQDRVKILDFGVAKLLAQSGMTAAGAILGTPTYMAPEQTRGESLDGRADIYSIGVIAYECLAGRPPFSCTDFESLVLQHRNKAPAPLNSIEAATPVSPGFARMVLRLLAKSPRDRMSARALRAALHKALHTGSTPHPMVRRRPVRPRTTATESSGEKIVAASAQVNLFRHWKWGLLGLTAAVAIGTVPGGLPNADRRQALAGRAAQSGSQTDSALPAMSDAGIQSIAVLPFEDLSPRNDQQYFARGVAEELLNVLSRSKGLRVASRRSSFALQSRDLPVPEIARELNVAHILEGSIRRSGHTVRITVQLIDTRSDSYLWSTTYDRPLTMDNLLRIQSEIAKAIVDTLKVKLTVMPNRTGASISLESFELFCKAREHIGERKVASLRMAQTALRRVVEQSPDFAPGYALLADTLMLLAVYTGANLAAAVPEAEALVLRALELDSQSVEALVTRAALEFMKPEQDLLLAIDFAQRAVAMNPNHAMAYLRLAEALSAHGRGPEAVEAAKAAHRLDPMSPVIGFFLSQAFLDTNQLEQAQRQARHVIRLNADSPFGYAALRDIAVISARYADAFAHAQDAHARSPGGRYANRNYYADVMLAYLTGYESAALPEAYLAFRRGDQGRLEEYIGQVHFPIHRAYLRYRQRDFLGARKAIDGWMQTTKLEHKPVQTDASAEILLLLEDILRKSGASPPFIMKALASYFAESRPRDLEVGRHLLCRAKFEILNGRPGKALGWIERSLKLRFAGDFLDEPIFDEIRRRPDFARYAKTNRRLVRDHHRDIDRLISEPRPGWIAPVGRVYERKRSQAIR